MNICIGTANWAQGYGVDVSFDECKDILYKAYQNKVMYIDTAQDYNGVESLIGNIYPDSIPFRVITKLSHDYVHGDFDTLLKAVRSSLEKLGVPKLYALLLHDEDTLFYYRIAKDIEKLKSEGFIDKFGVSIYSPDKALDYAFESAIDIIQVPFNILDRRLINNGFFSLAKGKDIFIRSIFLKGALLMTQKQLRENNLLHLSETLNETHNYMIYHNLNIDYFCIKCVQETLRKIDPSFTLILAVDNAEQLIRNLQIIYLTKLPQELIDMWWNMLPEYDEKILNPAMWEK